MHSHVAHGSHVLAMTSLSGLAFKGPWPSKLRRDRLGLCRYLISDVMLAPGMEDTRKEISYHVLFPWMGGKLQPDLEVELNQILNRIFTRGANLSFAAPGPALASVLELTVGLLCNQ